MMMNFYLGLKKNLGFAAILLTFMSFTACKKNTPQASEISVLRVYNLSPAANTYNLYLNDNKYNDAALPFGGNTKYGMLPSGNYAAKFSFASDAQSQFSQNLNLSDGNHYSYFLVGMPNQLDGMLIHDDTSVPSSSAAYLRIIHASPNAEKLLLRVKDKNTVGDGATFKTASSYTQMLPGIYTFEVLKASDNSVIATLEDHKLEATGHYSILAKGLLNEQGTYAFSADFVVSQ